MVCTHVPIWQLCCMCRFGSCVACADSASCVTTHPGLKLVEDLEALAEGSNAQLLRHVEDSVIALHLELIEQSA